MSTVTTWLVDGNNVFGSRPDGWWNDRPAAMARFTNKVATWCWTHDDRVVIIFDRPVPAEVIELSGGNLTVWAARRKGPNAADDVIAEMALGTSPETDGNHERSITVVTSDKGLRKRLPPEVEVIGVGRFREMIEY